METNKPRRITRKPHPDSEKAKAGIIVEAEYVDFKPITEDWSIWELADGTRTRAKMILSEVVLLRDLETKEIIRRDDGAPTYGATIGITVVFEPSESSFLSKESDG